jgi:3-oxoacyl-[acyl-carrier protein] reductase
LDIVVNNAGFAWDAPIHKLRDEQYRAMLEIHTIVPFRLLRAAAPHLRRRPPDSSGSRAGKVVNVSSISGTAGNGGQSGYAAGKAALLGLTRALAKEWGQFKINVNAVAFGFVETRLTESKETAGSFEKDGETIPLGIPEQMRQMGFATIPLGRGATPREAAGPVFFLCSPWSNYVHGQVLNVTGGQSLGMTT